MYNLVQIVLLVLFGLFHYFAGLVDDGPDPDIALRFLRRDLNPQNFELFPKLRKSALRHNLLANSLIQLAAFSLRAVLNPDPQFLLLPRSVGIVLLHEQLGCFSLDFFTDLLHFLVG